MNLTSDLYQTLAQASCDCEAIGNAWVFQCHQRGEGWGGVERSLSRLPDGRVCSHGHMTRLPFHPIIGLRKEQSIWIFALVANIQHRKKFTCPPGQSLHFSKESPEKQGNLLNVTQLFGGWSEPGNHSP